MRWLPFILWLCVFPLHGAPHYIRAGATGAADGSTWANAWTIFGAVTWTRGDTYYVAAGTYTEDVSVTKPVSGSTWITIKKANLTDNSADAGWDASYTNLALVNGHFNIINPYIELDGVTGTGTNGHGIEVICTNASVMTTGNGSGNIFVHHLNLHGLGFGSASNGYSVMVMNNVPTTAKGLHVADCWLHDVVINGFSAGGVVGTSWEDYGLLFENNIISETGGALDPANHGQGMQFGYATEMAYLIIRGNRFRNIEGTGMIAWLAGTGSVHHHARIYNNVFHIQDTSKYYYLSPSVIVSLTGGEVNTNVLIANNTFYGIAGSVTNQAMVRLWGDTGTNGNFCVNNLWEGCQFGSAFVGVGMTNNAFYASSGDTIPSGTPGQVNGASTAFVNALLENFQLLPTSYALGGGMTLSDIFTTDKAGTTRMGTWTIGAYQNAAGAGLSPASIGTAHVGTLLIGP